MRVPEWASNHRLALTTFVFVAAVFLLLGYRNEIHDREITRAQAAIAQSQRQIRDNYRTLAYGIRQNCEARNKAVGRFNSALEAVALNDPVTRADPAKRAAALERVEPFRLVPDDCTRYPPG